MQKTVAGLQEQAGEMDSKDPQVKLLICRLNQATVILERLSGDESPKEEDPKEEDPKDESPKDESPKDEDPKNESSAKKKKKTT